MTRSPQPSPKNLNLATPKRIFHVITLIVFLDGNSLIIKDSYITASSKSSN